MFKDSSSTLFLYSNFLMMSPAWSILFCRSISILPTAAAYNNKAQAEIKLQDWDSALQDCEKVLDMEPGNVKGRVKYKSVFLCIILFLANKIVVCIHSCC